MANWLTRLFTGTKKATEGSYRPGPYALSDGWLSAAAGKFKNFWQMGYSPSPYGQSGAMVEACISSYAQTIAMCPGGHWRKRSDGGRDLVTNSALAKIMRKPNDYQTISDFLMNLTRRLYENGETFILGIRNNRNEIIEVHLMRHGYPRLAVDGSIFYDLGGNEIVEQRFDLSSPIPARDVAHVRLNTPRHPLKGESPILATILDRALSGAALNQQVAFYLNQARPSYTLETDRDLSVEQSRDLRARWKEQTTGENAGGTPILSWGLKAKAHPQSAADGQLAEMLKMSDQNIALAFRVPLQVLGVGDTPFASTEALMSSWKATGLGFALNHIEEAFGQLFKLGGYPEEYLELDTKALLRSNFKELIEGLARSTISGIHSSDEARNELDLPVTPGGVGAEPRVQQQVVPLSYGFEMQPPQQQPAANDSEENDEGRDDEEKHAIEDIYDRIIALS